MSTVLTLPGSERSLARLRSALRDEAFREPVRVVRLDAWRQVTEALSAERAAVVFFDPGHPGAAAPAEVARTIATSPATGFVVYCADPGRLSPQLLLDLGRAGVRTALTAGLDDHPERLRSLVLTALAEGATERLLQEIEPRLTPAQVEVVRFIVRHAPHAPRLQDLARRVNVSTRTIERRAGEAGLPSPARILSWVHLYNGSSALLSSPSGWREAAGPIGFSSGSSFRRALKRVVGLTKTALLEIADERALARAFARALVGPPPTRARTLEVPRWLEEADALVAAVSEAAPLVLSRRVPGLSHRALSASSARRPS